MPRLNLVIVKNVATTIEKLFEPEGIWRPYCIPIDRIVNAVEVLELHYFKERALVERYARAACRRLVLTGKLRNGKEKILHYEANIPEGGE